MEIPQHIQIALGVPSPIAEDDLAAHKNVDEFSQATFGLSASEFALAAKNATAGQIIFEVSPGKRVPNSWQYLEVLFEGQNACAGVCTPESAAGVPPTAASQVLVGAWFFDHTIIEGDIIAPKKVVHAITTAICPTAFKRSLIKTWSEVCPLLEGSVVRPVWMSKTQIKLQTNSRILIEHVPGFRFQDLFLETISEVKTKWRYLSLYRIFEHGYLSEVFENLKVSFFASPKESLAEAASSLESELNQFVALVSRAKLENQFVSFHDEFETARSSGNHFAAAIERSLSQSGQLKTIKGKWQKGVLVCYKIRCAIVHAGVNSPIYDAYADGSSCLEAVLPVCESAAFQFLGIAAT